MELQFQITSNKQTLNSDSGSRYGQHLHDQKNTVTLIVHTTKLYELSMLQYFSWSCSFLGKLVNSVF